MRVAIAFPLACKQKMVIYHGKRPSTQNLYDRTIKLIDATRYKDLLAAIHHSGTGLCEHYPIQANIFQRYPTSINQCDNLHYYDAHFNLNLTFGYCGLDGMVMHDLLTHFKFNLSSPENENCNIYGFAIPGNISGSLGCIVRDELDLSFNSRFMTLYSDEHIYYLHYITTDKLCALVKKTGVIPLWHGAFNVYRPLLWSILMGVLVLISGVMWVTAIVNHTMTGEKVMAYWYYLVNSVMTTLMGCSPMKTRSMIMIRSACLTGSILFLGVYQGHVSRVYTTVKHFERITTLDELYTSGATLYTTPGIRQFTKQLQRPGNKIEEAFFNNTRLILNERIGITLEIPLATTLDRKSDAEMKILEHFSDSEGRPLIDIVDECFMTYYLSYITRSGFPFFEVIQIFTQRLLEAGLPTMYYKWTQQMLNIPTSMPETRSEPRPFSKIKLQDQRVAFFILFGGSVLSIIVFAAEIWKGRPVEHS
uniref:Ionotropic glutamate receptor C-terminal domain-containing protein n=1 Tax=Heliothis virescens TaxID=7102 RepID=A0A2A4J1L4_HELVI